MRKHLFEEKRISLYPKAVVLVSASDPTGNIGAAPIAWNGIISSRPTVIGVSFLPDSYTRACIVESREFVVNIPDQSLLTETNFLGTVSGPWQEKMRLLKENHDKTLTLAPSKFIKAPQIQECFLNFECRVLQILQMGFYDCFLGEVLAMYSQEDVFSTSHPRGSIDFGKVQPILCLGDEYWSSGIKLGHSTENKNHPLAHRH